MLVPRVLDVFECHSTTVRFDFEDDTPFFLVRFTFIGQLWGFRARNFVVHHVDMESISFAET